MGYIDMHTHHEPVLANVTSILHCAPDRVSFQRPFSVGIHPWFIQHDNLEEDLHLLKEALSHKNCLAIGECGMDKVIKVDFKLQQTVFEHQIQLSETFQKPMIIHCVKAYSEVLALRKRYKAKQQWIIHGYRKNRLLAKQLLDHGILLSFGAALLNDLELQNLVQELPLDRFFLETDDEAISIQSIYQEVSKLKQRSLFEVQEHISNNFNSIFIR